MFKSLLFTTFILFIIGGGLIYYQDDNYFTKTTKYQKTIDSFQNNLIPKP